MNWTSRSKEDIDKFVRETWPEEPYCDYRVEIARADADSAEFTLKQMYKYVELDFAKLKAVSDFFGTLNVLTDMDSYGGCETCDYGSSYEVTFKVRRDAT